MRCHYEVLNIERNANADEIKKAYRKAALKWHPDKNQDNIEEADRIFKEINAAYEVLSDQNERTWYDNHRESILAGGDGTAGDDAVSQVPNLWQWFSAGAFSGYSDDEKGFYTVYKKAFEDIDVAEMQAPNAVTGEINAAPSFGTSLSIDKDVEAFYSYWGGFLSRLNFGWADKYNPCEAETRYQRRAIEKENKKHRDAEKRRYVEQVRNLVEYCKKRDKRMMEIIRKKRAMKEQRENERREALQNQKKLKKKSREESARHFELELALREKEEIESGQKIFRLADEQGNESGDNDLQGTVEKICLEDVWRCEACAKTFKSEKQLVNHERSKKHKDGVKRLRKQMLQEESRILRELEAEQSTESQDTNDFADKKVGTEGNGSLHEESNMKNVNNIDGRKSDNESDSNDSDSDDSLAGFGAFGRRRNVSSRSESIESRELTENVGVEFTMNENDTICEGEVNEVDDDIIKQNEQLKPSLGNVDSEHENNVVVPGSGTELPKPPANEMKHAPKESIKEKQDDSNIKCTICSICNLEFASRNQLFKHIKSSGHVAPIDAMQKSPIDAMKKSKKHKKKKNR